MHINIVKGDLVVGYSTESYKKYEQKVKGLIDEGFVLKSTEYGINGDMYECFEKGDEIFNITHLAV